MTLFNSSLSEEDKNPAAIQRAAEAEQALETLMRLYYIRHGFQGTDVYLASPLAKLGLRAVSKIASAPTDEELDAVRSTLFLAAKGLHLQSSSYYIAQMLRHILVNQMRPQERQLLQSVVGSSDGNIDLLEQNVHATQARWTPAVGSVLELSEEQELSRLAGQTRSRNRRHAMEQMGRIKQLGGRAKRSSANTSYQRYFN
ncbi:hypothetical protein E8E11_005503 [Didymella keratinophila]|nr:hypothetical protein E8E11_005503 [Didymella keratinophila]